MPQWALALVAACVAIVPTGVAYAAFSGTTANNGSNVVTATTLSAPTGLTAVPAGRDVSLSWTAASPANGYDIQAGAASGSSCASTTFTTLGTSPTVPSGTTYTDALRAGPSGSAPTAPAVAQGTFYCYRARTRYSLWQSPATSAVAVQVGVVATSLSIVKNGNTTGCASSGAAGALDCGDQIIITFNQAMNTTTGPSSGDTVCGASGGTTILLASNTPSGGCSTGTETVDVGSLTTPSLTNTQRYPATYTWSAGNTVLTITLGTRQSGPKNLVVGTGTFTYNPTTTTTSLRSTANAVHVCDSTTGGGVCKPSTTSGF
jgi:hypothetical protein